MNGAHVVAQALRDAGVDIAYGLPGAHNLALWPACAEAGVRIVGMRTEQGCAQAADGYAWSTGRVGVAIVTTGPGAANTIGAVGEAWASRTPLVVIATDIPSNLRYEGTYRGILHESTDQAALFAPLTKQRVTVSDPAQLEAVIGAAVRIAAEAPTRPVYVGIPYDFLGVDTPQALATFAPTRSPRPNLQPLIDALPRSQRPVIWAGGGARDAGDEIDTFARRIGAPVVTTFQARGLLAPDNPMLVGAPAHEPEVTALIATADLAIVIGSDLDQMNTMQWRLPLPPRRIAINLDGPDATKNYAMDGVAIADARIVGPIADEITPREPWAGDLTDIRNAVRERLANYALSRDAIAFVEHTETALPSDTAVFTDMCVPGYWLAGHMRVETRRGLHFPMGWGSLGFAAAAAIGASAARSSTPTVAFVGDGGMLFGLGELSALAATRAPCTIVVVDDGGYGMLRFGSAATPQANDLPHIDFVQAATAFGIHATRVDGLDTDYAKVLAEAVASDEPRLIHVRARLHPPATTTPFWPLKDEPA